MKWEDTPRGRLTTHVFNLINQYLQKYPIRGARFIYGEFMYFWGLRTLSILPREIPHPENACRIGRSPIPWKACFRP